MTSRGPAPTGSSRDGLVRVELPAQLRTLAGLSTKEVGVRVEGRVTQRSVLDALERDLEVLSGTIRDRRTGTRRPFLRYFACGEDLSHDSPDAPLPEKVVCGAEPFIVLGAIAGG